jgi:hypothetical protein
VLGFSRTAAEAAANPQPVTPVGSEHVRSVPLGSLPAPGRQHAGGTITNVIPRAASASLGAVPILLLLLTFEMLVLGRRLARWSRKRNRGNPTWTGPLVPSWS